ncbi:kinesin-like protein KIN-14C [Salvia hispanica]|uniref:kinesin-like protein KIN-14C n=1 Tax=Salvia hispanica TaxID=49212 RepID=UPI0020094779|nr:kinesin-like protein KIN-14C [Salvia hispanica]
MDRNVKDSAGLNSSSSSSRSDGFASVSSINVKQQACLVEWINSVLPDLHFPANASDNELRDILIDGSVLCRIVNKIKPGSISERDSRPKVERFLSAMDEMGLPRFQVDDLEKGSMKMVLDCLWTLRMHFMMRFSRMDSMNSGWKSGGDRGGSANSTPKEDRFRMLSSPPFGEDRRKLLPDTKSVHGMRNSPKMTASVISHSGHKFHEVFQLKQGSYADLPAAKITEMMKSNSLDNAPTQSLLSVVNGILDESVEMKSGAIPHSVVCLLRKVVQEIERRICTQAEHLRTQNNVFKAREEKYQSRIRVLEALATGTSEETQIVMNQLKQIKNDKNKFEEKKKADEHETWKLVKEKDDLNQVVANLRQELRGMNDMTSSGQDYSERSEFNQESEKTRQETRRIQEHEAMKTSELEHKLKETQSLLTESRTRTTKQELEDRLKEAVSSLDESRSRVKELEATRDEVKELEAMDTDARTTKQELEDRLKEAVSSLAESRSRVKELEEMRVEESRVKELEGMDTDARTTKQELEDKLKEAVSSLDESRSRVKELEALSKSKSEWWKKKEQLHQIFTDSQLGALHILRFTYQSIQQEIEKTELYYSEALSDLGSKIKVLADAAKNYHPLLAENRKLHNELQELKGNIRVYCRIRPFLPGQKGKQSIIENIGENGELTVANPAKPGKEGRRSFRFDKVYGLSSTQAQVFADTQPLIQSVLDGFNVCIFAYGQTGSGKTYTMTGPDGASEDEWGVNYRALKNLFTITQDRGTIFKYEVSVQMVEIYNEQVRDLLSNDGQKKLGILTSSQPNGLAVPDANIQQVNTSEEVMKLMDIGLQNRAKSATAMNERSSRSHSIVSIHTRGTELKSGSSLRGSLHLVDLAGSERVDRSEVTGDRLKEAQHINKSLSALGDVVFALSQKSAHVPYRNSKLTQVLQSSLGGHAKTLMFVQLNPDATSFSETLSTLKFAERVSGVELGAAKSSRDSKEVRELTDQIATLKESLAKKDEELGALQKPLRDPKIGVSGERRGPRSMR